MYKISEEQIEELSSVMHDMEQAVAESAGPLTGGGLLPIYVRLGNAAYKLLRTRGVLEDLEKC